MADEMVRMFTEEWVREQREKLKMSIIPYKDVDKNPFYKTHWDRVCLEIDRLFGEEAMKNAKRE